MTRSVAAALAAQPLKLPENASRRHFENDPNAIERTRKDVAPFLDGLKIFHNQLLVVVYKRPDVTAGGVIRHRLTTEEDTWQGKVGLVVAKGPTAFLDNESHTFMGQSVEIDDWVLYAIQNTRLLEIAGVECRVLTDRSVVATLSRPDLAW